MSTKLESDTFEYSFDSFRPTLDKLANDPLENTEEARNSMISRDHKMTTSRRSGRFSKVDSAPFHQEERYDARRIAVPLAEFHRITFKRIM